MNKTILRSTVFILSAALLAACAPKTQTTLSVPVSPPATLTDEPNPTAASVEPAPAPSADLQPAPAGEGWLLVNTEHGLWMGRPDGSEGALRIHGYVIVPGPLPDALSPAEGLFAYLTTSDITGNFGNLPDLTLNVISLTGHGEAAAIPLTSPLTEPGGEFPSDIQRAMVEQKSFAWSPEGMRLAYIGAAQGPSADLYEYLRESGEAVQLTDGPDQAFAPQWSPDGLWIVHAAAATFGTGAGIGVTGVYAARADGRGAFSLYDIPQYSGNEELLGWLDTDTAVMRSWFATCGPSNLRLVNLSNETVDEVFGGCLSATAVGGGAVLLAQSPDTAMFDAARQRRRPRSRVGGGRRRVHRPGGGFPTAGNLARRTGPHPAGEPLPPAGRLTGRPGLGVHGVAVRRRHLRHLCRRVRHAAGADLRRRCLAGPDVFCARRRALLHHRVRQSLPRPGAGLVARPAGLGPDPGVV
jgi:hypothetical protein